MRCKSSTDCTGIFLLPSSTFLTICTVHFWNFITYTPVRCQGQGLYSSSTFNTVALLHPSHFQYLPQYFIHTEGTTEVLAVLNKSLLNKTEFWNMVSPLYSTDFASSFLILLPFSFGNSNAWKVCIWKYCWVSRNSLLLGLFRTLCKSCWGALTRPLSNISSKVRWSAMFQKHLWTKKCWSFWSQ